MDKGLNILFFNPLVSKSLCTCNFSYEKFSYNVDFSSRPALRSGLLSIVKALPVTMAVCVLAVRLTRDFKIIYLSFKT